MKWRAFTSALVVFHSTNVASFPGFAFFKFAKRSGGKFGTSEKRAEAKREERKEERKRERGKRKAWAPKSRYGRRAVEERGQAQQRTTYCPRTLLNNCLLADR